MGSLACLVQASFTIAGPDYVSMAAGTFFVIPQN